MVYHHPHETQQAMAGQQQSPPKVEYFYVYVAESEFSTVGFWIQLEPDKTLSLDILRGYFSTCFGIKHKVLNANNEVEVRYIRYQNGFFHLPPGLNLNNTRFVAYYYTDVEDIRAFMGMAESGDGDGAGEAATLALRTPQLPAEGNNDSAVLGRTMDIFNMDSILRRGAQSTPVKGKPMQPVRENVSSTSDVILNEPTVEVITIKDSQTSYTLPPPPPLETPNPVQPMPSTSSGIRAKLGPSVSSSSDDRKKNTERAKHERITISDSSGFQRDRSSVMVTVNAAPKTKNMLDRYQQTRPAPQDVGKKTPLKVTLKGRNRQTQRNTKILKIEDEKGRTTALLTKKKWPDTAESRGQKRRSESGDELDERYEKRRRYDRHYQNYQQPETKPFAGYGNEVREINVLLVGFRDQPPIGHETNKYFSEFGIVTYLKSFPQESRRGMTEYYAFMTIRAKDALSLFSDRHIYNGTIIYAIRVDGTRCPSKITCSLCGYYGLNAGYLHYHVEGQCHQQQLKKRLEFRAAEMGQKVYLDSYYRISNDELFVQFPTNDVQEMVHNDYWRRGFQSATYGADPRSGNRNYYGTAARERYY